MGSVAVALVRLHVAVQRMFDLPLLPF